MSKDEEQQEPEFKVHDRRRIHLDDEPGPGSSSDATAAEPPEERPAAGAESQDEDVSVSPSKEEMDNARELADAAAKGHRRPPEADFTTFVISLASSAVVHLGDIPHPEGGKAEINLPMAKQVIDMLSMLKEKTKGNLEPDESRYLEAILYDLRLRFVEASGRKTAP